MNMVLVRCAVVAVLFLASPFILAQEIFKFTASPGAYAVGLKIVNQYDESRTFKSGKRPIQTLLWYPAQTGGKRISYGEYLLTIGSADDFFRTPTEQKQVMDTIIHDITDGKRDAQIAFARDQTM